MTAHSGNPLAVGHNLSDATGSLLAGTAITAFGTGTGGTGSYIVNNSQSVSSKTMVAVADRDNYNSVTGNFAGDDQVATGASCTQHYGIRQVQGNADDHLYNTVKGNSLIGNCSAPYVKLSVTDNWEQ